MFFFLDNVIQSYLNFLLVRIVIIFLFHLFFVIWFSFESEIFNFRVIWSGKIFWSKRWLSHLLNWRITIIFIIEFIRNLCDVKRFFHILNFLFLLSDLCQRCFQLCLKNLEIIFPWLRCKSILIIGLNLTFYDSSSLILLFFRLLFKWIFFSACSSNKLIIEPI